MEKNEEDIAKVKTLEMVRGNFETSKKRWTMYDAPGHKDYVADMIMAAAVADYAVLVISAKNDEFEASFEAIIDQIQLVKSLGVNKLVIFVNKIDEPTKDLQKGRYDTVIEVLKPFLASSGYETYFDCTFIPVKFC